MSVTLAEISLYGLGIAIPNLGGILISFIISDVFASTWYRNLKLAPFQPPAWVFPVAWTILYTLMGIASVWVYQATGSLYSTPMLYYWIQLLLNNLWSIINFKFKSLGWAFMEILVLDTMVGFTIAEFYAVDVRAGQIMLPYAAWLLIATTLSYSNWLLNRDNYLLMDEYENLDSNQTKNNLKEKNSVNNWSPPPPYGTIKNNSAPGLVIITP